MRTPFVIVCLLLTAVAAGCVTEDAKPAVNTNADLVEASPVVQSPPQTVAVKTGVLGPVVTRNETMDFFVEATGDVAVQLFYNDTQVAGEVLAGNKTWTIALEFGTKLLRAEVSTAAGVQRSSVNVTRLGATTITVDWGMLHTGYPGEATSRTDEVWIDVDARPSLPLYDAEEADHVDAYTAHDQIRQWELETGIPVVATYSASLQGFGVDKIDGQGKPLTSQSPPYWCYKVNGVTMDVGMSLAPMKPGDHVDWILGAGFC